MKKLVSILLCLALLASGLAVLAEGGWTCPSCGTENEADHNFCGHCGAPRDTSWTCPACGNVNKDNFCTKCGQPKPDAGAASEPAEMSAEELYEKGKAAYDEEDYETALEYLQPAADQGNASAQFYVGLMYRNGNGVEQDFTEALKYYSLAAAHGNAGAQNNLGTMHYNGEGVEKDYKKAAEYFQLASDNGDQYATNNLGLMYENGFGVEQDYGKAAEYYQLAADRGNGDAPDNLKRVQEKLAATPKTELLSAEELYEKGNAALNEGDYETALKYFQPAADQGKASAQFYMGRMYHKGYCVDQDYGKAAEYYRLAADQGNAAAQNNLGTLYEDGHGVEQDYEKAAEYYQLAADNGSEKAPDNLKRVQEKLAATPEPTSKPTEAPKPAAKANGNYDIPDLLQYATGVVGIANVGTQAVMDQPYRSNYWLYTCFSGNVDWLQSYIDAITETGNFSFLKEEKNTYFFRYTGNKSVRSIDTPAMRTDVEHELVIWVYYGSANGIDVYVVAAPELTYAGDYVKVVERYENGEFIGDGSGGNDGQTGGSGGDNTWDFSSEPVKSPCSKCHGNKEIDCTLCNGSGGQWVYSQVPNYGGSTSPNNTSKNWEKCSKCHGSGRITCPNCGGSGYN